MTKVVLEAGQSVKPPQAFHASCLDGSKESSRLGHRKHGTHVFAHLDLHQQRTVLLEELQISSL
jgi:hypothetical protein